MAAAHNPETKPGSTKSDHAKPENSRAFAHHRTVRAWVEALFPAGEHLPAPDACELASEAQRYFSNIPGLQQAITTLLASLELRFLLAHRRSFASAPLKQRRAFIEKHRQSPVAGPLLRMLSIPFRMAYLLDGNNLLRMQTHNGIPGPSQVETFRWHSQLSTANDLPPAQTIEADVVVIGSGAGGAAAAYELASRGLAVVILEEGHYHDRRDFNGKLTEIIPKLYRASGVTAAIGSAVIPVPVGKGVGGTTTVNSGTCLRTPERVLQQWMSWGLQDLSPQAMLPYFEQVEAVLQVQPADPKYVGPIGDVIQKGAHKIGLKQTHPLMRNAAGCDGQGLCQFGCPTGAKQSTNISYIPKALDQGAFMFTGMKADRLQMKGNTVVGLTAQGVAQDGIVRHLTIKAPQVVVSMGTLFTPLFLQANGIKNRWLGANLSIHPAGAVTGFYANQNFANTRSIPQGYGISDWADDDIMFEGGTPPFVAHGLLSPMTGYDFVDFAESYQNTGYFGFMIKDQSRGRVRKGLHPDVPFITYNMNKRDFSLFLKATRTLAKIHLRAGADYVHLVGLAKYPRIYTEEMVDKVIDSGLKPRHFAISAYHPLGTCRIAANPANGVCDVNHQVFGVDGLYVMDGSAVPSSLGANPQVTIMALASRAAEKLAHKIAQQYYAQA
ncbi:MAG: GMC oxidoreductase [Gammaproteobacteria bacterium]|nr:MAG: GMC oxidoreductase [Gammaproteobacteria bacterium]